MKTENNKSILMESESVPKSLLKLGIPTMVGMMTSALYNIVDTYFVGALGTSQTAAVSVAYPLSIIFLAIGLLFGTGASSSLARLLGKREQEQADICFSTALISAVVTGIFLVCLMLIVLNPMLSLLGATQTIMPYARTFAIPFLIGLVLNVFNIAMNNMIAAEGATSYSMIAMLAGGITNMILDPILIFGLGMGVKGAAIATLIARCISFSFYLYYLISGKSNFHFSFRNVSPSKKLYGEIFKIGVPMLCYQLLCSVALAVTNYMAKAYGDSVVAGIGVANRIISLGSMMLTGFLKGYQPFVGYNFSAGNEERAKEATRIMKYWSTCFCVVTGILVIVFHKQLMLLFSATGDQKMIDIGGKVLIMNAITFIGMGVSMVYNFLFLAVGRAREAGIISVTRQGLFLLPLIIILANIMGVNGIVVAQPIADVITFAMIFKMTYHKTFLTVSEKETVLV